MIKTHKLILTTLTTGAMLISSLTPAFAATTLIITGNGSNTDNTTNLTSTNTTTVTQGNSTQVDNHVDVDANTGGNTVEDNTGGDTGIETGDVDVEVNLATQANSNMAEVAPCGGCATDTTVEISGNGTHSDNNANLTQTNTVGVTQFNAADIKNDVDVDARTGKNSAEDNTGGSAVISTGDASVKVNTSTMANSNVAKVGGTGSDPGSVSLLIAGNGSESDNTINLKLLRSVGLMQQNLTDINNKIDVDVKTGENKIEDSTGGLVGIETGDVDMEVNVSNEAGFNAADLGCDCAIEDVFAKIANNGTDADSTINATLDGLSALSQWNSCGEAVNALGYKPEQHRDGCIDNSLYLDGYTGMNKAEDNTGAPTGDDPYIGTGDVDSKVDVENTGGYNVYGNLDMPEWEWPDFSGMNFSFSFDMSDFMQWWLSQQA